MGQSEAGSNPTETTTEDAKNVSLPDTLIPYTDDESHWSQNHGPILLGIAVFVLLAGYGFIFFQKADTEDFSRPLVPNNFVPDEEGEGAPATGGALEEENTQPAESGSPPTPTPEDTSK